MRDYNPLSILRAPEQPKPNTPPEPPQTPQPIAPTPSGAPDASSSANDLSAKEFPPLNPAPGSVEERVAAAIKECYDPEIPVNIYELGLIYAIEVNADEHARITMTLTAPNCPAAQSLPLEVQRRVEAVEGVKTAEVDITFFPQWTPDKMSDAAKLQLNIL
jgi:FeS assembly SUF system protein